MNTVNETTLLVVDDDDQARRGKSRALSAAGFHVVEARTGAEALQAALEHKPDLMLLDIHLPDLDGFEVCRRLRANPVTASITIVHITASLERPEHQVRGLEGGADIFLVAPIDPKVLVATVRAMIRMRHAENALRESDRRKDEFLAVLAHELRNPLAPLRYGLRIFQQANLTDPTLRTVRQIMERQIGQMVRLIDDLLEISRINQNKLELRRAYTTVEDALDSAIETCRPALEAAHHRLEVSLPPQPLSLFADGARLAQIFGNLISNSIKYMNPGGYIHITAHQEAAQAVIAISDQGIGIASEDMETLFDMFTQARRETADQSGGLGIGLALVKRLVEMHGGTIEANSPGPGRGSAFTVRLPMVPASSVPSDAEAREPIPETAPLSHKVLVVDDNRDSADSLAMIVESLGHDVRVAYDGREAVEVAEVFRPALILMDVSMPHVNGLEAAQQIRARDWGRNIVICALTGYGQDEDRRRSEKAGIDRHLVKPVDPEQLIRMLAQ